MPIAYLSIGSNIEPHRHVCRCLDELRKRFGEIDVSRIYESTAVGFSGDNFLNLVAGIQSDLELPELADWLRDLEGRCGRVRQRQGGYDSRTLDIDLLTYGDLRGEFDGIKLPRPEIARRAFVIWPLADLIPGWRCPELFDGTLAEYRDRFELGDDRIWAVELQGCVG